MTTIDWWYCHCDLAFVCPPMALDAMVNTHTHTHTQTKKDEKRRIRRRWRRLLACNLGRHVSDDLVSTAMWEIDECADAVDGSCDEVNGRPATARTHHKLSRKWTTNNARYGGLLLQKKLFSCKSWMWICNIVALVIVVAIDSRLYLKWRTWSHSSLARRPSDWPDGRTSCTPSVPCKRKSA